LFATKIELEIFSFLYFHYFYYYQNSSILNFEFFILRNNQQTPISYFKNKTKNKTKMFYYFCKCLNVKITIENIDSISTNDEQIMREFIEKENNPDLTEHFLNSDAKFKYSMIKGTIDNHQYLSIKYPQLMQQQQQQHLSSTSSPSYSIQKCRYCDLFTHCLINLDSSLSPSHSTDESTNLSNIFLILNTKQMIVRVIFKL
jgi:hypothetical protein